MGHDVCSRQSVRRVVHLPYYEDNPYQRLLMEAQQEAGLEVISGGSGGNFFRSAVFRWKADLLHFHWLHPYMTRRGRLATILRSSRLIIEMILIRASGVRIYWTMHNLVSHESKHASLETFFRKVAARLFHGVAVHSEIAKQVATEQYRVPPQRIRVTPHPNYINYYPNKTDRQTARETLSLCEDSFAILFLGRVAPYKGVTELTEAFGKLEAKDLRLLIAGHAGDAFFEEVLRESARDDERVELHLRRIADSDVGLYMAAADVVALPFRQILTSGSLILAASFGKPVIAPRSGGISELLPDDYPLLYESPDQLTNKLKFAYENANDLAAWGEVCLASVKDSTWKGYAEDLNALYSDSGEAKNE